MTTTSAPSRRTQVLRALGVLLLLVLPGGGGGSESPTGEATRDKPFPGSAPTMELLARDVLDGLVRGDTATLERFRLTESEHNEVVWPELPAAAPAVNFPVELAWQNIQLRNRRDLRRILPWFGGRRVEFRAIQCRGPVEAFQTFRVHTDCHVIFDTEGHGLFEARIFKDVLERGGGFKIFRYYDREPRGVAGS